MISASDRFLAAQSESHRPVEILEVITPGQPRSFLAVVDGETTVDRTRSVRYECDLTLDPTVTLSPALSPYRSRLRLWRGIDFAGSWRPDQGLSGQDVEWLPSGLFRMQDAAVSLPQGKLQISGLGPESYCVDDTFTTTGYLPPGSAQAGLLRFVGESIPGPFPTDLQVPDVQTPGGSWDSARWGDDSAACQMLARACGGSEVFFDAYGTLILRPTPGMDDLVSGLVDSGPAGTLVTMTKSYTRDGVVNVVTATSSATSGADQTGLWAISWDSDPYSPTFLHRTDPYVNLSEQNEATFGRCRLPYSSPLLGTLIQCQQAADSVLADKRGLVTQTGVTCAPDRTLEAGDVVYARTDLGLERQLVDGFTFPISGAMSLTCRSTRIVL